MVVPNRSQPDSAVIHMLRFAHCTCERWNGHVELDCALGLQIQKSSTGQNNFTPTFRSSFPLANPAVPWPIGSARRVRGTHTFGYEITA